MRTSLFIKSVLAAAAIAAPMLATAESNFQTGAGALTATAHVDFQITIPKFLFLRVGTGTGTSLARRLRHLATVDQITWAPTAAQVGTGVLAGTGGDLTGGVETAVVVGNSGNVTLSSTTTGPLSDGAGDTISYATITTTATANTTGTVAGGPGARGRRHHDYHADGGGQDRAAGCEVGVHLRERHDPARRHVRWYQRQRRPRYVHRFGAVTVGRLEYRCTMSPGRRDMHKRPQGSSSPLAMKPRRAAAALAIGCLARSGRRLSPSRPR